MIYDNGVTAYHSKTLLPYVAEFQYEGNRILKDAQNMSREAELWLCENTDGLWRYNWYDLHEWVWRLLTNVEDTNPPRLMFSFNTRNEAVLFKLTFG